LFGVGAPVCPTRINAERMLLEHRVVRIVESGRW
jgi:hypothetical protein